MLGVDDGAKSYRMPPEERGFYELAIAIVRTAVEDYRRCRKNYLIHDSKSAYGLMVGLRTFFLSDFFENISVVEDPYDFLRKLDSDIDREVQEGRKRKRLKQTRLIK